MGIEMAGSHFLSSPPERKKTPVIMAGLPAYRATYSENWLFLCLRRNPLAEQFLFRSLLTAAGTARELHPIPF